MRLLFLFFFCVFLDKTSLLFGAFMVKYIGSCKGGVTG